MRVAVIGRTEILYETAERLIADGHEIALVVTAKEAPEYLRTAEDFEALAARTGAHFIRTARIAEIRDRILALGPIDIAIGMNYPGLIPKSITDLFPLGILNAHPGDLPRYRGNACTAWAILNGEERAALCVHRMIGGELDNGEIITRDYRVIDGDTTVGTLWDWLRERAPSLFSEALAALDRDPSFVLEYQSERPEDILRCYPRRPEDGRIDWHRSAVEIDRLVRASHKPLSGAFTFLDGKQITVWGAKPVQDGERFCAIPGQITRIGDGSVDVATGEGKVRISSIDADGATVSPDALIRSVRTRLG
jgi:UDP-4-amino-4-deoxy-L-arabinose formyltransferase/UDP-glucuronic acid dehydrogenase (UDP-4-keto-hexauronic acid decarboxylating)